MQHSAFMEAGFPEERVTFEADAQSSELIQPRIMAVDDSAGPALSVAFF